MSAGEATPHDGGWVVLSLADEERLGRLTFSFAAFRRKVLQGRGATACIFLELSNVDGGDIDDDPLVVSSFGKDVLTGLLVLRS